MFIDARITAVAVARAAEFFDAQLERGQSRVVADRLRGELIRRNARLEIGAGRFSRLRTGEKCRRSAGMVAGPVAIRPGLVAGQPAENEHIAAMRLQRL